MMMGCPSARSRSGWMSRATISLAPPAANGTIKWRGRDGQVCEQTGVASAISTEAARNARRSPPFIAQRSEVAMWFAVLHAPRWVIARCLEKAIRGANTLHRHDQIFILH